MAFLCDNAAHVVRSIETMEERDSIAGLAFDRRGTVNLWSPAESDSGWSHDPLVAPGYEVPEFRWHLMLRILAGKYDPGPEGEVDAIMRLVSAEPALCRCGIPALDNQTLGHYAASTGDTELMKQLLHNDWEAEDSASQSVADACLTEEVSDILRSARSKPDEAASHVEKVATWLSGGGSSGLNDMEAKAALANCADHHVGLHSPVQFDGRSVQVAAQAQGVTCTCIAFAEQPEPEPERWMEPADLRQDASKDHYDAGRGL